MKYKNREKINNSFDGQFCNFSNMNRFVLGTLFLLTFSFSASAQDTTDYPAIRAVVQKLFDGMRQGDSTLVHSAFAPDAVMFTTYKDKKGTPYVEQGILKDFLDAVGTPREETWDERIHDVEIRADDGLAHVWAPYVFYLDGVKVHCGVNAFQLVKTIDGWKIQSLTDSRRREPC